MLFVLFPNINSQIGFPSRASPSRRPTDVQKEVTGRDYNNYLILETIEHQALACEPRANAQQQAQSVDLLGCRISLLQSARRLEEGIFHPHIVSSKLISNSA